MKKHTFKITASIETPDAIAIEKISAILTERIASITGIVTITTTSSDIRHVREIGTFNIVINTHDVEKCGQSDEEIERGLACIIDMLTNEEHEVDGDTWCLPIEYSGRDGYEIDE